MSSDSQVKNTVKTKSGIAPLIATIVIQLTLGIAYIWSVFQTSIANSIFDGHNAKANLTFSILLATLTIGSVIGGRLAVKFCTRNVIFIGGIILSAGFFLASFVKPEYSWLLWLTYGAMGGVGMGFTYSTTIACVQKWYPHKKGLVTGITVASLGFGGVVFTPIVEKLIVMFDGEQVTAIKKMLSDKLITPAEASEKMMAIGNTSEFGDFKAFMVLSGVFLVVCTVGCIFLKSPHGQDAAALKASVAPCKSLAPIQMLKTPQFYLITAALMLACIGGLMMIGFAKPIAVGKGLEASATIGVLAISLFNSAGRLFWGMISDKLGRINTILILLTGSSIFSLMVNMANGYWIYVLIAFIGFFYGGILSNFPSLTAESFGAKHMATNYGFVLLGFGLGAIISSQVAGHFKDVAAQDINLMLPAFIIGSCCSASAIVLILILRSLNKKAAKQSER